MYGSKSSNTTATVTTTLEFHASAFVDEEQVMAVSYRVLKMNEMLQTPILQGMLDENVLFVLKLLCGPLQGINMRNLIWHGFLDGMFKPIFLILKR